MTITGKVFKAYAEAVIAKHGFGSNKMVREDSPEFISNEIMRGQRLVSKRTWARNSLSITEEEAEAAERAGEEGERIWTELKNAEKWLIENGYLREYSWVAVNAAHHHFVDRSGDCIGLTAKGWAVANKYLNA